MKLWPVVSGVARRTLKNALTNPQIVLPRRYTGGAR